MDETARAAEPQAAVAEQLVAQLLRRHPVIVGDRRQVAAKRRDRLRTGGPRRGYRNAGEDLVTRSTRQGHAREQHHAQHCDEADRYTKAEHHRKFSTTAKRHVG